MSARNYTSTATSKTVGGTGIASGTTTVLSAGSTAAQPQLAQYKSAACIKTGTDAWYVVGAVA